MDFSALVTIIVIVTVAFIVFKFIVNPLLKLVGVVVLFIAILYVIKYYFNININQSLDSYSSKVDIDSFLERIRYFVDLISLYAKQFGHF